LLCAWREVLILRQQVADSATMDNNENFKYLLILPKMALLLLS
jgi:hypothetical protein